VKRLGLPVALVALGCLLFVACGGGSSGTPDAGGVPTATPPAQLPEPIIIGEVQPAGEPETYVVESGDTLFGIAEKLGVDPEEIISLNDLADPSNLEIGQVLLVPGQPAPSPELPVLPGEPATVEPSAEEPAAEEPSAPVAEGENTYTVESGDNASAIAESCGFTVEELAAANSTTVEGLRELAVGQVLLLPGPCGAPAPEPEVTEVPPEEVPPEVTEVPPEATEVPPEPTEVPPDIIILTPEPTFAPEPTVAPTEVIILTPEPPPPTATAPPPPPPTPTPLPVPVP
jgi:LysM repeat protein